jgi:Flp pilus assembly protein TadG
MKRHANFLRQILRAGCQGQVILMVGLATIVMFGIVGLAVDVGRLYVTRVELGRALDAAALSSILELDGTTTGIDNAKAKAQTYFDDNEPGATLYTPVVCNGEAGDPCNGDTNTVILDADKSVGMIFLSVLGIHSASVSAHAKAGFGTQFLDAVMVLDATPSMAGNPIEQAVVAADIFKDILLGTNPQGNVKIGLTAFRGCFKPTPGPHSECVDTNNWVRYLTHEQTSLDTALSNIENASGGASVATNVCTGLAMGWNIVSGPGNHDNDVGYPGNRQYMILLSDGDNAYWGNNTFASPYYTSGSYNNASSPTGTTVGSSVYPCQPIDSVAGSAGSECPAPWNNPSISSSYPCYKGIHQPLTQVAEDNFNGPGNGCPGSWDSGSGWADSGWVRNPASGNDAPTFLTSSSPNDTGCHVRIRGSGYMCRAIDLSAYGAATLTYAAKYSSWESSDDALIQAGTTSCSSGLTTLHTHTRNNTGTSYDSYSENLDAFAGQTVYIVFKGTMSAGSSGDNFYVDTVGVTAGSNGSSTGYLNGSDGSNPGNCDSNQTPRERQMDVRTIELAQAIKAQGVEVFVVAFAGGVANCHLDYPDLLYDDDNPAHCGTVLQDSAYPIGQAGADGNNPKPATNPNVRLLKCIASSTNGTDDHYFFASDASELSGIFTKIANQIAHRLIE